MHTPTGRRRRLRHADSPGRQRFSFGRRFTAPSPERPIHSGAGETFAGTDLVELPRWKRATDLSLVVLALPVLLVIALVVSLWIRAVSPGTVLFRQTRIGKGGRRFTIYKFRSMHMRAATHGHEEHVRSLIRSNRPMTKLDRLGDDRLIRGGLFLRMSGLDELPQLLNVLRGEMSLVGPRPCLPKELELYHDSDLHRFAVEPGLTGLWQVQRGERTTFRQMLAMDEEYVARRSPLGDLGIMLRTPMVLCRQLAAGGAPVKVPRPERPARRPRGAAKVGGMFQPVHATQKLD